MPSTNLLDFVRNIYDTDVTAEREKILRARLELYGIIVDTVASELGLPALSEADRTTRLQTMLVESAIRDSIAITNV